MKEENVPFATIDPSDTNTPKLDQLIEELERGPRISIVWFLMLRAMQEIRDHLREVK